MSTASLMHELAFNMRMCNSITANKHSSTALRISGHGRTHRRRLPCSVGSVMHCPTARRTVCAEAAAVSTSIVPSKELQYELDPRGLERIKYDLDGWNFWTWRGHRVHWVAAGPEDAPPLVLVHGYGASAYHWRYNIPALARTHRVYAICLLGFGWSEKALVDYTNGNQWIAQISDFVEQVVGRPVALAGNSLGGYASLATAAFRPDLIRGVALLNGAGPISDPAQPLVDPDAPMGAAERIRIAVTGLIKRVVLYFAFNRAKQPERIKEVLQLVYVNRQQVDDDLVNSIVSPALDPQACEVFYRLNHGLKPPLTVNILLNKLQSPLLLLWGMRDPWITPARAEAVRALYPAAQMVPLPGAGHCPHDDTPEAANSALQAWLETLPTTAPLTLTAMAARLRV